MLIDQGISLNVANSLQKLQTENKKNRRAENNLTDSRTLHSVDLANLLLHNFRYWFGRHNVSTVLAPSYLIHWYPASFLPSPLWPHKKSTHLRLITLSSPTTWISMGKARFIFLYSSDVTWYTGSISIFNGRELRTGGQHWIVRHLRHFPHKTCLQMKLN